MTLLKTAFMSMLATSTALTALPALAQTRAETLRHVTGASINTLDPNMPGSTREAFHKNLGRRCAAQMST